MAQVNVKPLADRVLVEPAAAEQKTAGGIIIPDTAKEKPQKGIVVAIGNGKKDEPLTVKVGDQVLYGKYSGTEITVEGKDYYMPGEVCDTIGQDWLFGPSDPPRPDLLQQYLACRDRGANLLLNVPPDKHGLITDEYVHALMSMKKNAGI